MDMDYLILAILSYFVFWVVHRWWLKSTLLGVHGPDILQNKKISLFILFFSILMLVFSSFFSYLYKKPFVILPPILTLGLALYFRKKNVREISNIIRLGVYAYANEISDGKNSEEARRHVMQQLDPQFSYYYESEKMNLPLHVYIYDFLSKKSLVPMVDGQRTFKYIDMIKSTVDMYLKAAGIDDKSVFDDIASLKKM